MTLAQLTPSFAEGRLKVVGGKGLNCPAGIRGRRMERASARSGDLGLCLAPLGGRRLASRRGGLLWVPGQSWALELLGHVRHVLHVPAAAADILGWGGRGQR